ncbi:MAG: copper chaperone CopZ [Leptospiraceae bacterium]|nr:copper chaperone CopZ [Leptospiraceae bacterium]MCP5499210.1 copper chaperone CopZ [Leptospiraceae bacterium]
MAIETIIVEGMSCQHCVKAVTGAVQALSGIHSVEVSLEKKEVKVDFDPSKTLLQAIKDQIEEEGYTVKS